MADKKYQIDFEMTDGSTQSVEFTVPQGEKGDPGDDYVLTEADKQEIAELAAPLVDVPEGGGGTATMQPLTFTGAVNATYDGSEAVSVEIPVGGGSSGGSDRLIAKYVHTKNRVIQPTALDLATGVFTCVGHGLKTGDEAIVINDDYYIYVPFELLSTMRVSIGSPSVRVIDADTFVLKYGSTDITYPHEANTKVDVSKWHIEIVQSETIILKGFSAQSIEVYINGFYWGTNNYCLGLYPMENSQVISSILKSDYATTDIANNSTICPFMSGSLRIGQEYEADVVALTPSKELTDYTYLQQYPEYISWGFRCICKTSKYVWPLKNHGDITGLKICTQDNKYPVRLANGFTVEVYRRG